jgi:hypothetical protein
VKILVLAIVGALAFAGRATAAQQSGIVTAACPAFAYQQAADGGFYIQPVTYRLRGRSKLIVRFTYETVSGGRRSVSKAYAVSPGKRVMSLSVREDRRGDGIRRHYRRWCVPNLKSARRRHVRIGYYSPTANLPLAGAWVLPGTRIGPGRTPPRPTTPPSPASPVQGAAPPVTPVDGAPALKDAYTAIASGDISLCLNNVTGQPAQGQHPGEGAIATAKMLAAAGPLDAILELGDAVYESGTPGEFADCYDRTWGALKSITHPVAGNHEYRCGTLVSTDGCTAPAKGYFDYFGAAGGPRGQGYYSFDIGAWHVIALNSELDRSVAAATTSAQRAWLRADLAAHPARCTLAMWHKPAFSNDPRHGDDPRMKVYFGDLYDAGADLVLQGHVHAYQRWAELGPAGTRERGRGVRSIIAGLGGATIREVRSGRPGQEVAYNANYGVLKLTLTATGYSWVWLNAPDNTTSGVRGELQESGATNCH